VGNILIRIIGHFFKWWHKLVAEYVLIDELSLLIYYFRHTELYVWNIIFSSLKENWNNMLCDLFFHDEWHNSSKGVETTHSIVVSFLVNSVMIVNDWDIFGHNPFLFKGSCEGNTLRNTHLSDTSSSVSKVSHEDALKLFAIDFFSKYDSKICNKFENPHSNPPLPVFCHIS